MGMERDTTHTTIAITVWNDRVSPVFDSARNLLIVEIRNYKIMRSWRTGFNPSSIRILRRSLFIWKVNVILCGAISEKPAFILEEAGFILIPFIAGEVNKVISAFLQDHVDLAVFSMPGCSKERWCRRFQQNTIRNSLVEL